MLTDVQNGSPNPQLNIGSITNYPITSNGTQNIPIPTGYDAVNSISVDVNVPDPTNINYFMSVYNLSKNYSYNNKLYGFEEWVLWNEDTNISGQENDGMIFAVLEKPSDNNWHMYIYGVKIGNVGNQLVSLLPNDLVRQPNDDYEVYIAGFNYTEGTPSTKEIIIKDDNARGGVLYSYFQCGYGNGSYIQTTTGTILINWTTITAGYNSPFAINMSYELVWDDKNRRWVYLNNDCVAAPPSNNSNLLQKLKNERKIKD